MTQALSLLELASLYPLMQQMLEHAKRGDWEGLRELDRKRLTLLQGESQLESAVAHYSGESDDEARMTMETMIRKLDKDIMAEVMKARETLVNESSELRKQVKAKKLYEQASSLRFSSAG